MSENRNVPIRRKQLPDSTLWERYSRWLWLPVWLLPLAAAQGVAIAVLDPDGPLHLEFVCSFAGPAVIMLVLLSVFRIGVATAFGASAALAAHLIILLAVTILLSDRNDFWWPYLVTFPGIFVGCVLIVAYRGKLASVRPFAAIVRSAALVLVPALGVLGALLLRHFVFRSN